MKSNDEDVLKEILAKAGSVDKEEGQVCDWSVGCLVTQLNNILYMLQLRHQFVLLLRGV